MSAKDGRNIWERIFSYFERLLRGTRKGDWVILFIVLIVIFVLAFCFLGPVESFTFVLAVATIWNVKITQGLLRRSEETSVQTRQAFEIDIFNKIVSSASQLNAELRALKNFPQTERPEYVENFVTGMLATLKDIDPIIFEKIGEAIKTWNKIDNRTPATTYLRALNKTKGKQVPNKPKKRIGNG